MQPLLITTSVCSRQASVIIGILLNYSHCHMLKKLTEALSHLCEPLCTCVYMYMYLVLGLCGFTVLIDIYAFYEHSLRTS